MDYGIDNRLVRRQVEAIIKHQELVPADIRTIFELLLGPTSYMLFLNKWQERLEEKQLRNMELSQGDPLRFATLAQLMGRGQYLDPQRQAALGACLLGQSQAAALEAFALLLQVGRPKQPYLQIRQAGGEPFLAFVDCIKEGVEIAPDSPFNMKDTLVKEITVQNANANCKRLIATLSTGAMLMQIVEQCSQAPIEEEKEKAKIHATALAAALTKAQKQGSGDRGSTCFNCGQQGHIRKNCPVKGGKAQTPIPSGPFVGYCHRCDKFGHQANECHSRFKKNGTPLTNPGIQGNERSRMGRVVTTRISPPTVAALMNFKQPQEEAQELIW
ncbi:endogenous retrovirus group K member 8 Gag polyprotein-like [Lonchura striata]